MSVAQLAVALSGDHHRAQARSVEEGLGRAVQAARGLTTCAADLPGTGARRNVAAGALWSDLPRSL